MIVIGIDPGVSGAIALLDAATIDSSVFLSSEWSDPDHYPNQRGLMHDKWPDRRWTWGSFRNRNQPRERD
jgi:hypothetical protein